jgi:hypothetical protein
VILSGLPPLTQTTSYRKISYPSYVTYIELMCS